MAAIIEVRVGELRQLFNSIDPSPFHERDLDPKAEEFIVDWAKDLPREAALEMVVYLDGASSAADAAALEEGVHEFFAQRVATTRRRLRELFHRGRISLLIAVAFLAAALGVGERVAASFPSERLALLVREGVLIVGWVAMWRPVEVFLYDWWPIRADLRLYSRLATMPIRLDARRETDAGALPRQP
jgi:hypothetical protein